MLCCWSPHWVFDINIHDNLNNRVCCLGVEGRIHLQFGFPNQCLRQRLSAASNTPISFLRSSLRLCVSTESEARASTSSSVMLLTAAGENIMGMRRTRQRSRARLITLLVNVRLDIYRLLELPFFCLVFISVKGLFLYLVVSFHLHNDIAWIKSGIGV